VRPDEWDDYYIVRLDEPAIYHNADGTTRDLPEIAQMVDNLDVLDLGLVTTDAEDERTTRSALSFEDLLGEAGWLTVPQMVTFLEAKRYWLRHPTVLSRHAKQRYVEYHLQGLRGPHSMPVFIRALREKTNEIEYIHSLSVTSEDILRAGRYLLGESLKHRPQNRRVAAADHPVMTMDIEGRLVICAEREADPASVERAWHILDHLQSPDAETRAEEAIQGLLSRYLRELIEVGVLEFMEGVKLQEQQSTRVHLRRIDGMRLLAQLLAAVEFLGAEAGEDDNIVSRAYEAGLFASWSAPHAG